TVGTNRRGGSKNKFSATSATAGSSANHVTSPAENFDLDAYRNDNVEDSDSSDSDNEQAPQFQVAG
ncbi:unnamed protein product, partial [Amoebophrya sp. A25]